MMDSNMRFVTTHIRIIIAIAIMNRMIEKG